jgi:hypothetical protein
VTIDALIDQHLPDLRFEQAQALLHLLGMSRIEFGLRLVGSTGCAPNRRRGKR